MSTTFERTPWAMPEWMEPYRDLIESDLGGNSTENLLNDTKTTGFNNTIRAALISMADSKVRMLHSLHTRGLLREAIGNQQAPGA